MRFSKVHIEISNVCNLQCSFCPEVVRSKKLMDLDLFETAVRQVAPIADQIAFHLMGDPLVHPKLAELTALTHKYGAKIILVTNGVLLRGEKEELLLHPAYRQICFSLHSFHDNYGDRDPSEYLERIFSFVERAFVERPDLYINFRLWNLQDPRGGSDLNRGMLARVAERFGVEVPESVNVRRQKSYRLKNRLYMHFDTEFVWPSLDHPTLGVSGTCYGMSSHFGILADGTVVPCCLDKEGKIALGNLRDESLNSILTSPRAQGILNGFRSRKLVESLCQKCRYIERFSPRTDITRAMSIKPTQHEPAASPL